MASEMEENVDPGVASLIPARFYTFVEIGHERRKHSGM